MSIKIYIAPDRLRQILSSYCHARAYLHLTVCQLANTRPLNDRGRNGGETVIALSQNRRCNVLTCQIFILFESLYQKRLATYVGQMNV
jgi:hypothetical protein